MDFCVESGTEWQMAATSLHNDVLLVRRTSRVRGPVALMPTLIRWWEALRAPEVAKWQQQYRVDWDATDGRNGGAQRTVWEVLMEMERPKWKGKSTRSRSCGLGPRPSEGTRAGQPSCGLGLGDAFQLSKEDVAGAADPLTTITAILPGSEWSCSHLRIVLQDALSEVTKIYLSLKLRVFIDDITALVRGNIKQVSEMVKKVMMKLKEVEKWRRKASSCQSLKMTRKKRARSLRLVESWKMISVNLAKRKEIPWQRAWKRWEWT